MEPFTPQISFEKARLRAENLCAEMTLKEKADFVQGYEQFFIRAYEQHGIPYIYMTDASQGVHIRPDLKTGHIRQPEKSVAYPCIITLASTWDPELAYEYARSVGEECRASGIHVLLGPAFNLYRNSQCGRNFEYMGEDPFLVSRLVEAFVSGVQNTGTMATIKHFICNNTDFYRRRSNSVVDERALHEMYLPGFKAGVDAGAMSVMTSYNQLNGEWCGQSSFVINELLRTRLGFKWLVMSDWTSIWDAEKFLTSGQDLDMPGPSVENIEQLVTSGRADEKNLDRMVTSIITSCIAMGFYDRDQKDLSCAGKEKEHETIALNTAREGIVLLKNSGVLPLSRATRILAFGDAIDRIPEGGGAATVKGYGHISMKSALEAEFGDSISFQPEPGDEAIKEAETVLISVATYDSEGWDRPFRLPREKDEYIARVCSLNPNTVVVVNSGSGISMNSWNHLAGAVIYSWYPGQNGFAALAEILSGKTNPSGKLPISIERKFSDSPAYGYVPEGEELYDGWPANELDHPVYDVRYDEGIFVGYRWYEKKRIEPLYHFGHGLSYTAFEYSNLATDREHYGTDDQVTVECSLTNVGKFTGCEILQLYIGDDECSVDRPVKELKGFKRVCLAPGRSEKVTLTIPTRDFAFWDPKTKAWTVEPGTFTLFVGASSADIRLSKTVSVG